LNSRRLARRVKAMDGLNKWTRPWRTKSSD